MADAWEDNSLSSVMEYPFDFDKYIEERLREVDDLDERRFAKTVLLEGLGKIIKKMEERYQSLETRVYKEIKIPANYYEIITTIVKREHYDPTNDTLFPIYPQDILDKKDRDYLLKDGRYYVETIFLKSDLKDAQNMIEKGFFNGTVAVNGVKKQAVFCIERSKRYLHAVENLYKVFQDNHLPWETVNISYLEHFFDVYLDVGNNIETDYLFEIDYEDYADKILRNHIPLWNIEQIYFDSTDFRIPCMNGIYYEHEFSLEDTEAGDGYLIQTNEDIQEIRYETEKIIIKSIQETFHKWIALRIVQSETIHSLDYDYPILTNRKKDTFLRRYLEQNRGALLTKADLFRRIMELDIEEYIEITDYEIIDDGKAYPIQSGMNWFVKDEVFPMEGRKILLLIFKEKIKNHYLNESIIKYAVSQMQMEINEYRCVGVKVT